MEYKLRWGIFDATTNTKWKGIIDEKIAYKRKLQFWPNLELMSNAHDRGIFMKNLNWLP